MLKNVTVGAYLLLCSACAISPNNSPEANFSDLKASEFSSKPVHLSEPAAAATSEKAKQNNMSPVPAPPPPAKAEAASHTEGTLQKDPKAKPANDKAKAKTDVKNTPTSTPTPSK